MLNDILTGKASLETPSAPSSAPLAPRAPVVYEPVYVQPSDEIDPVWRWLLYIVVAIGMGYIKYRIRTGA